MLRVKIELVGKMAGYKPGRGRLEKAFREGLIQKTNRVVKERQATVARLMVRKLIDTSPVFTGRFRASWYATLGAPVSLSRVPARSYVPNSIKPEYRKQVGDIAGYGRSPGPPEKVVVSNPNYYWWKLENEHAAAGFIERAKNEAIMEARIKPSESGSLEGPAVKYGTKAVIGIFG